MMKADYTDGRLTASRANTVKEPGRFSDGNGLYLVVTKPGAKHWVLFVAPCHHRIA